MMDAGSAGSTFLSSDRPPYAEVLPPGTTIPEPQYEQNNYYRPPPPAKRPRRGWASAPATYVLAGINCAVFLLMVLHGAGILEPSADQLPGADDSFKILVLGEWWRTVTAMFVHGGIVHLVLNMWCLWNLGLLGEPLLGPVGLIAVYLLTGLAGNILSVAAHPPPFIGVGASGAVFGIAGVLILLLKSPLLPVPPSELKRLRQSVIYFAAINLVLGFGTSMFNSPVRTDNMAHLGGFVSGLLIGMPLLPRIGAARERFARRQWLTFSAATLLVLLFAFGVNAFWHSPR